MKKLSIIIGIGVVALGAAAIPHHQKQRVIVGGSQPTYFAQIASDGSNTVVRVIVATQDFINTGSVGDPENWVRTYYDGSKKKNYAGRGFKYDKNLDAFIPPRPKKGSWVLDPINGRWKNNDPKPLITNTASK